MSTTSLNLFNNMLDEFVSELERVFPNESSIKVYHTQLKILRNSNQRAVLELFMGACLPVIDKIMTRDESFFIGSSGFEILEKMNYRSWWSQADPDTKSAIWFHLQSLSYVGSTLMQLDPKLLGMIEVLARKAREAYE